MKNILLIVDNEEDNMGDFNQDCMNELLRILSNGSYNLVKITGQDIQKQKVEDAITSFQEQPFLCIAYSHGVEDALIANRDKYFSLTNAYFLNTSNVYTFSCLSAKELGQFLAEKKITSYFWGYEEVIHFITDNPTFAECANYGILQYFAGDSWEAAFQKARVFYDIKVNQEPSFIIAAQLAENRDAMVLLTST